VDSQEEEEEEEEEKEEESGTAHRRRHVATPWASHHLLLGRGGMWEDKKVLRRSCLQTHVVTPWETRRLVWNQRRKMWGLQKPIQDISGTSDEDDSLDEKNELSVNSSQRTVKHLFAFNNDELAVLSNGVVASSCVLAQYYSQQLHSSCIFHVLWLFKEWIIRVDYHF